MSDLPPAVQLPLVMTATGPQPTSPDALRAQLVQLATALAPPGYVAALPGTLVEDIASTDVGALIVADQARVENVNAVTPLGANAYVLAQLGQIYGVPLGSGSNATVDVEFSAFDSLGNPLPGQVIARGFVVGDGTNQYVVQDGGVTGAGGTTQPLSTLATLPGTWPIPAGSVTTVVSSLPPSVATLTVTNPLAGIPGEGAQDETSYRSQVLQAGLAASMGMSRYLKTLLGNVSGVQSNLISAQPQTGGGWKIIVGGGDAYMVAFAVYSALFDVSTLVPSEIMVSGVTQANPGVVDTSPYYHGYTTGDSVTLTDSNPVNYDGTYTVAALSPTTFSIGVDTSLYPAYVSGAVCTPNPRNVTAAINDYPDVYVIPLVRPPAMVTTITVTWNTTASGFTGGPAIAQLVPPALVAYVNAVPVGQPLNVFEMQEVVQYAIAGVLPAYLLTRLVFAVNLNGTGVSPSAGTGIISGDPESYFSLVETGVTVAQG